MFLSMSFSVPDGTGKPNEKGIDFYRSWPDCWPKTALICPEGIYDLLMYLHTEYNGVKIIVTENGASLLSGSNISAESILLPDINLNPDDIKVMMINEAPPQNPDDWFYSKSDSPDYMKSTLF